MSTPPASENVDICGQERSVTGADGRYSHQHDHELLLRQQSEQEQLSRVQELPPEGSIGHVLGQDSGQVHSWSHQEQPFQQDVVLQLQAAAETISAVNGSIHSTMAEYLAHVTAAASGDAFGHGYPGDNAQMQIPMSELMAHVAPGDGEITATDGIGGMVGVQMLQPTEQLQYGGQPEIEDQAPPAQLLPGDMRMQVTVTVPVSRSVLESIKALDTISRSDNRGQIKIVTECSVDCEVRTFRAPNHEPRC